MGQKYLRSEKEKKQDRGVSCGQRSQLCIPKHQPNRMEHSFDLMILFVGCLITYVLSVVAYKHFFLGGWGPFSTQLKVDIVSSPSLEVSAFQRPDVDGPSCLLNHTHKYLGLFYLFLHNSPHPRSFSSLPAKTRKAAGLPL